VLRHRTQILYVADISVVVSILGLRPGMLTASLPLCLTRSLTASLTHSLPYSMLLCLSADAAGYTVLESGTGSGSLTHSLARAVAPNGRVATFDFHEQRAAEAAEEFKRHGLSPLVTVGHRNIEENGFPETGADGLLGAAHAVFLDLPGPWRVVPSASRCLRPGGTFCAFSPCIEQVCRGGTPGLDGRVLGRQGSGMV
jgi:tRNA (adenine57-N1/adenine58-N1)-methyltransferase catalytic subunit